MTTGVLTTSFPRYRGDFAGCFVEDAVRACVATGETVEVIAAGAGAGGAAGEPLGAQDQEDARPDLGSAVRVFRVAMPFVEGDRRLFFGPGAPEILEQGGLTAWVQAAFFWAGLSESTRARSRSWDRIVAHWLIPCGLVATTVAPHLPLIAHAHSGDIALLERVPGGATLGRRLARAVSDLIFASADLQRRFARLTGIVAGRVAVANPVPTPTQAMTNRAVSVRAATKQVLKLDQRTVLSVGRLVPIKGFDVLLRAAAVARSRDQPGGHVPTTIVILGEGPERARLEAMARRLDIDLRLPGAVAREAVSIWMTAADLYVQPSRRLPNGRTEGLPVATLEAMATGLPVIASATGGLAELAGIRLVPADDAAALAALLLSD